jgi:chromosome segregation ATPase
MAQAVPAAAAPSAMQARAEFAENKWRAAEKAHQQAQKRIGELLEEGRLLRSEMARLQVASSAQQEGSLRAAEMRAAAAEVQVQELQGLRAALQQSVSELTSQVRRRVCTRRCDE